MQFKNILPSIPCRVLITLILSPILPVSADTWTCWRGAAGINHAAEGTRAPTRWDFKTGENITWKTKIPGRGHSSPVILEEAIFLTTADQQKQTQSLLKINRESGRLMNQWILHTGTLPKRIHSNNSHASPTPAFDGEDLLVVFYTNDAIMLTRVTLDGRTLWQKKVADFKPKRFQFGYGASPLVEENLVIVAAEYDGKDSGLYAFDRRTGDRVWKVKRPSNLNFASPIAATIAGQRQILLAGAKTVAAYDPVSGKTLWSIDETTEAICGTVVWDQRRVMISGGNPGSGVWCVSGDGTRKQLWNNGVKCYEQSLLVIPNYVFGIADSGVGYCWRTSDGQEMWKKRLFSGGISASPLLVRDQMYVANEAGNVFVVAAIPDRFEVVAENPTGDSIFASPVVVDDQLFLRTSVGQGRDRQEYLLAIGGRR